MGSYNRKGIAPGSHTADKVARRAAAIERVRALLANEPMTSRAIADTLGMSTQTVHGYLIHLEGEGLVCKSGRLDRGGRLLWAAGNPAEKVAAEHARRALVVPARQEGKQRDPLVAALFGPAQHA